MGEAFIIVVLSSEQMENILTKSNMGSDHKKNFIEDIVENINKDEASVFDRWLKFFKQSHGEIFEQLDYKDPEKQAFAHSVYYDYVVDLLIESMEDTYNFKLSNRSSSYNNKTVGFSIRDAYPEESDNYSENPFDGLDREDFNDLDADSLRIIQRSVIPKDMRMALGEFHTPLSVCRTIVRNIGEKKVQNESFMDPGSGSGTFISACIEKKIEKGGDTDLRQVLNNVYAIDLNPISVKSTKLSYLIAVSDLIQDEGIQDIELPVFLKDALELTRNDRIIYRDSIIDLSVDNLIGNPPYVTWDNLPKNVKNAWVDEYVERLSLLPKEGADKRLGHANDDISVSYAWVCIHKYLNSNGSATFVMKRDLMKGSSGELFRNMEVGDVNLSLEWVMDFNKLRPFGSDVQVDVATYSMSKSSTTDFPVSCKSIKSNNNSKSDFSSEESILDTLRFDNLELVPIDKRDSSSILVDRKIGREVLGECEYDIRHGVKGDRKSVFKIDKDTVNDIENDRVFPFVTSRHVVKFGLFGTPDRYLLPIDKSNENNLEHVKNELPKTYQYLDSHRDELGSRRSSWLSDGEFYNMFGVGDYTWKDYKVCWCRLGYKPHFAVFSEHKDSLLDKKMVVPGDHYMYIPLDNRMPAHYVNGLLNSTPYQEAIAAISSRGKSSITKSVINRLKIPEYSGKNLQKTIAEKSIECTKIVNSKSQGMSKRSYNSVEIDNLEEKKDELSDIVDKYIETQY